MILILLASLELETGGVGIYIYRWWELRCGASHVWGYNYNKTTATNAKTHEQILEDYLKKVKFTLQNTQINID